MAHHTEKKPARLKIKKGDQVVVLTGKDKGKRGEVLRVLREKQRIVVAGVNMIKKHQKPSASDAGGIKTMEAPLHISNVALLDPKEDKPTRIGFTVLKDGKKVRQAKRSGEVLA